MLGSHKRGTVDKVKNKEKWIFQKQKVQNFKVKYTSWEDPAEASAAGTDGPADK